MMIPNVISSSINRLEEEVDRMVSMINQILEKINEVKSTLQHFIRTKSIMADTKDLSPRSRE